MNELMKKYNVNGIVYELYKWTYRGFEKYNIYVYTRHYSSKVYRKEFSTKEKALEYILNKIMIKGAN